MFSKKVVSITLAALISTTALMGCSQSNNSSSSNSSKDSGSSSSKANSNASGKIGDGTQSFDLWLPMHVETSTGMSSHNEHPGAKLIEEATGVKVNYVNPVVNQEKENMNLRLGTNDLTDAFKYDVSTNYRGGIDGAIADKVIINPTKLIEQNAPNFMNIINSNPVFKKRVYSDNGVLKGFGSTLVCDEMIGRPFFGLILNKKYLDEAKMEVPKTIDQWEKLLTKYKEMGIKAPITWSGNNQLGGTESIFASAFGVASCFSDSSHSPYIVVDGKVKYSPAEPGYKDYITLMNKWYANGLIDKDFMSRNGNKNVTPMLQKGEAAVIIGHIGTFNTAVTAAKKQGIDLDLVSAPYPVLKEGDKVHIRHQINASNPNPINISTKAKDPETIVKWIDFLYSDKGKFITNYGEKDVTCEYDANNVPHVKQEVQTSGTRTKIFKDIITMWEWPSQLDMYFLDQQHKAWDDYYSQADCDYVLPVDALELTIDEAEKFNQINGELDTFVKEKASKFVNGTEPLSNYDSFLSTIKEMRVDEAVKIYQAAYDRYLKR